MLARLMAALFAAGLPVPEVLRMLQQGAVRKEARAVFRSIGERVADGAGLGAAFEAEQGGFIPLSSRC